MPYTVTTIERKDGARGGKSVTVTSCAVIELAEVRDACHVAARQFGRTRHTSEVIDAALEVGDLEAGGDFTIPLPDGTVIEVEYVGWRYIEDSIGYHLGHPGGKAGALKEYNERYMP